MFRSVPVIPERFKNMELQEAFFEVQSICDDCTTDEHDTYCTVNVVLTALGILLEADIMFRTKIKGPRIEAGLDAMFHY